MFKILATTAALSLAALSANAATVNVSGTVTVPGGGNDFTSQLNAAGATVFITPDNIVVGAGGARLTFTAVAAESGYNNGFEAPGGISLSETGDFANFAAVGGQSTVFSAGPLKELLKFVSSGASDAFLGTDARFGIYASGTGPLSTFFLAFDDQDGGAVDDNHDDFIIRVDVAAVPLPAGGLLLIGAVGGLAALRRRKALSA